MNEARDNQLRLLLNMPELKRNPRAKLRGMLNLIDDETAKYLAIEFAEHVLWIVEEERPGDTRLSKALEASRSQLMYGQSLADVYRAYKAKDNLLDAIVQPGSALSVAAVATAIWCCCMQEFKEAGYFHPTLYVPSAFDVAKYASHAVAVYHGGEHWDSEDKRLKAEARAIGHQKSAVESEWQIQRLVDFIGFEQ